MLSEKQQQVFRYLKRFIRANDYVPSVRKIAKHFKRSHTTIQQHIEALRVKGYLDEDNQPISAKTNENQKNNSDLINIPLLGIIAAGQPIEAIENPETITIPKTMLAKSGKHYALKVKGNSMINEGIFDGDTVIIKEQPTAENGEMVVAIVNDNEATLKKLYQEQGQFRLQPANPALLPIYTNELEIRGKVVQIIRTFEEKEKKVQKKKSEEILRRRTDYLWDFGGVKTKSYTHGFHAYPAMFIPQVARRLILSYSKEGDTICDIFCGSGTALVEARLLGRNSWGIDLNPLAPFLAKVKTAPLNPDILQKTYFQLIDKISNIKNSEIEKPDFFNINFWFKEEVIIELAKIKKAIKEIKNENIRNFFTVAFSETVRLVSNKKSGEFKLVRRPKDKLKNYRPDVLGTFRKRGENNIRGMIDFYRDVDKKTWTKIILGDASKIGEIKNKSIDCIVTSPPYGDSRTTVAYGQFSRLSAQWIDIFEDSNKASGVDNELLGGKAVKELKHGLNSYYLNDILDKITKKDEKRAKDVLSFYIDLEKCLQRAYKILKPKKYFCLVVGNRLVKQVRIPTDFIIAEMGQNIGFKTVDIFVRNIPNKRMPSKNSPTNITGELEETMNKESIVVLKKS